MTSQHQTIFLFSMGLFTIFAMVSSDAILTVLAEHVSVYNTKSVEFNETMFKQFYICLCEQDRQECSIRYQLESEPYKQLAIQPINANSNQQSFSNHYQCNNNAAGQEVKCHRLRIQDMICKQTNNFTIIPRPSNISCDLTCVGLVWFNGGKESLIYNSTHQSKTKCPDCTQPPSTKTTTGSTTVASLVSATPPTTSFISATTLTTAALLPTAPPTTSELISTTTNNAWQPQSSSTTSVTKPTLSTTLKPTTQLPMSKSPGATTTNARQSQSLSTNSATKETEGSASISIESMNGNKNKNENDDNNSIPVIIGVVIGILLIVALVIVIIVVVCKRRKRHPRRPRSSSTQMIVSNRRNIHDNDDYDIVDIEPTTSNVVSMCHKTRGMPEYELATALSGCNTNNTETGATSHNNPHNGPMTQDEVCDYFGYSTVNTDNKDAAKTGTAKPNSENVPKDTSDLTTNEATNDTVNDFPIYAAVNKGKKKQNDINSFTNQDTGESPTPTQLSPDTDLAVYAVVNKPGKISKDYVNFLPESDEDANPVPPPLPPMYTQSVTTTIQELQPRPKRSSYDTVDIVGNNKENHPQIRSDDPTEGNNNTTDDGIPVYSVVNKTGKQDS